MLTPAQVAKIANVHPNTVRKYSRDYAEFLSENARGDDGPRLYNEEDVEVIRAIAALRNSGMPPAEVTRRLRAKDVPPVVDAEPSESTQTLHESTRVLHTIEGQLSTLQVPNEGIQAVLSELVLLRQELANRPAQRGERVSYFVSGMIFGFFCLIVALALWSYYAP